MPIIELHIPEDLSEKLRAVTSNEEEYIINLLRSELEEMESATTLTDEYRATASENTRLSRDFAHIDLEGWDNEY